MRNLVIIILLGVIAFFIFQPEPPTPEPKVIEKITVRYDTIPGDTVVLSGKTVYLPSPSDTVYLPGDTILKYEGEQSVDSGLTVLYKILTEGVIREMTFGVRDERPQIVKEIYKEREITYTKDPSGLYLSLGGSTNMDFHIGASYLKDRKMMGVGYDPFNKSIRLNFNYKLFK